MRVPLFGTPLYPTNDTSTITENLAILYIKQMTPVQYPPKKKSKMIPKQRINKKTPARHDISIYYSTSSFRKAESVLFIILLKIVLVELIISTM